MTSPRARWLWLALALGFAVSVGARFAASGRELWLDETHSALLAGMSLRELMAFVKGDVHPPLYFLLLNAWRRVSGDSELALRGFSILASALAGLVFLGTAIRAFGLRWAALVGSLLFWFSPALIFYGVEVRMYALASFWAAILLLGLGDLFDLYQKSEPRRGTVLAVVGAVGGFYTHYVMLLVLVGIGLFALIEVFRRGMPYRHVLGTAGLIGLACLPWAPVLLRQRAVKAELRRDELIAHSDSTSLSAGFDSNPDRTPAATLRAAVENTASVAGVLAAEDVVVLGLLAVPVLIPLGWSLLHSGRLPWGRLLFCVGLVTVGGGIAGGLTARRFLVVLVPFLAMALGESLAGLTRWRRTVGVATAVALLAVYAAGSTRVARARGPAPLRELVGYLGQRYRSGDVVIVEALYYEIPLEYQARQAGLPLPIEGFPQDIRDWWSAQSFKGWGGPVITRNDLHRFVGEVRRRVEPGHTLWLILAETRYYDPGNRLLATLQDSATRVDPIALTTPDAGVRAYAVTF
jgi:hypothetical protein